LAEHLGPESFDSTSEFRIGQSAMDRSGSTSCQTSGMRLRLTASKRSDQDIILLLSSFLGHFSPSHFESAHAHMDILSHQS
jgi:hypothetical protein